MMKFFIFLFFIGVEISVFSQQQSLSLDSAISYYQQLLKKDKYSPFGTYAMASVHFEKNNFKTAIEYCNLNLKTTNEYNSKAYLIKGISLDQLKRPGDAIAVYEAALGIFPDDYMLWYQKAFSCYKQQYFERAMKADYKVMQLVPNFSDAYKLHACLLYEYNNNKKLVYYLLYSLMMVDNKQESDLLLCFINNVMQNKNDNIEVPYFERRYELGQIDDVYKSYSKNNVLDIKNTAKELPNMLLLLDFNLENDSPLKSFYLKLKEDKLEETYINYCLRFSDIEYVSGWIKTNKDKLQQLAVFLDNHLQQ